MMNEISRNAQHTQKLRYQWLLRAGYLCVTSLIVINDYVKMKSIGFFLLREPLTLYPGPHWRYLDTEPCRTHKLLKEPQGEILWKYVSIDSRMPISSLATLTQRKWKNAICGYKDKEQQRIQPQLPRKLAGKRRKNPQTASSTGFSVSIVVVSRCIIRRYLN